MVNILSVYLFGKYIFSTCSLGFSGITLILIDRDITMLIYGQCCLQLFSQRTQISSHNINSRHKKRRSNKLSVYIYKYNNCEGLRSQATLYIYHNYKVTFKDI